MVAIATLQAVPWHSVQSLAKGRKEIRKVWRSTALPDARQESSGTEAIEEEEVEDEEEAAAAVTDDGSGCKTCGRSEVMWGCNGLGRIQGGIAAVPGFGWWPIKAFRPCPAFLESGGRYKRQGQRLDEFAYGRRISKADEEAFRAANPTRAASTRKKISKKRK